MTEAEVIKTFHETKNLFQSNVWQKFQEPLGRDAYRIKINNLEVLVIRYALFNKWTYLFVPNGPINISDAILNELLLEIGKISKKSDVFLRIEPPTDAKNDLKAVRKKGFKIVTEKSLLSRQISPENTLLMDLTLTEEEILAQMKPKGRYNIRLAQRKGVSIKTTTDPKDIRIYVDLLEELEGRGKYFGHPEKYYFKQFEALTGADAGKIYISYINDIPISAAIMGYAGEVATYLHGASSNYHREVMAPYLIQWQAIVDAKNDGFKVYDFWGISPENQNKHRLSSITDFKLKFGGIRVCDIGSFDFIFNKKIYKSLTMVNNLRKIIKR